MTLKCGLVTGWFSKGVYSLFLEEELELFARKGIQTYRLVVSFFRLLSISY